MRWVAERVSLALIVAVVVLMIVGVLPFGSPKSWLIPIMAGFVRWIASTD